MDTEEIRFSKHTLAIALLEIYQASTNNLNRYNVVGRPYDKSNLETKLDTSFTPRERALAYKALRELEDKGLIIPTYTDLASPGDWLTITDLGKRALKIGALDEFDELLLGLNSTSDLIALRYGAHDAIASRHTDWQRHAATSCRELITKVLYTIAKDEEILKDSKFVSDPTATNGITRAERIRHYLREKFGRIPKNDYEIIEKACDLVESCYKKLSLVTHTDNKLQISTLVKLSENSLIFVLGNEYE